MEIEKKIKERMDVLDMNQQQLALESKVSTAEISRILNGKVIPNIFTLAEICKVLNCSMDWMIGVSSKMTIE